MNPAEHRRLLLTVDDQRCPFGCRYCFACFSQYELPVTLAHVEANPGLLRGVDVVYPACDVDLFARRDALDILRRVAKLGTSISVSTKAAISTAETKALAGLSDRMRSNGHVFKLGVSFTTKHSVRSIEPRTPSYESRLRTLEALSLARIVTAGILRPLLADVHDSEYEEILFDASDVTSLILVGDEYVDDEPERRRVLPEGADTNVVMRSRQVKWAHHRPQWFVRETASRIAYLTRYAEDLGLRVFESDLDLMLSAVQDTRLTSKGCVA